MAVTFRNVLGGLGRVGVGSTGDPAHVGGVGPVVLAINVPGLTRSESTSARIGPVEIGIDVAGVTRGMNAGIGPVAVTINVPGVTRS